MCGIAGIIKLDQRKINLQDLILQMVNSISHRGPDDEGYVFFNKGLITAGGNDTQKESYNSKYLYSAKEHIRNVKGQFNIGLGHRRLSILDLSSAGHQPMCTADKKTWIVHNGEIYNYIELRKELKSIGYSFHSNTDTEVILKAYVRWGEDCVKKFNGMWAFAILDLDKKILFCSRDRFGVKPLYYYYDGIYFVFASEIKALLALPFVPKDVDNRMIYNYLLWGETESYSNTFYNKIKKLMNSNNIFFDLKANNLKIHKYYDLRYNPNFGKFDKDKAAAFSEELREKIVKAVTLRLRSDVSIGTCLSGGIDSSAIFMVINNLLSENKIKNRDLIGKNQKAFTSCFEDKRFDESEYAKIIVDKTNALWHHVYPDSKKLFQDLDDLVFHQDEPFRSTSIYAQYRVMKLAKESGIKVVLDGQGGDELFGGYGYHLESYLLDIMKNSINPVSFLKELRMIRNNSSINSGKFFVKTFLMSLLKSYSSKSVIKTLNRKRTIEFGYLNKDFFHDYKDYDQGYSRIINQGLNDLLCQDFNSKNLQRLLKWEDLNSMAFSIESRTPFSDDHELIEYVFSIPSCYKIHNGWMKWIFRESMKGIIPEKIRQRKDKKGFITSEKEWLIKEKNVIREIFINKKNEIGQYIDVERVIKDLDKILSFNRSKEISDFWRFINLAVWLPR